MKSGFSSEAAVGDRALRWRAGRAVAKQYQVDIFQIVK
jgi:hypothetical protein